jgi:ribonuclease HI
MGSFYVRQRFRADSQFEELEDEWAAEIPKPRVSYRADLGEIVDFDLPVETTLPEPVPPWREVSVEVELGVGESGSKRDAGWLLAAAAKQLLAERYRDHWKVFTDGSVGPCGAGAGVYMEASGACSAYAFRKCSSTVAELVAIVVALRQLEELPDLPRRVVVVSDSMPALQTVGGARGPESPICAEILSMARTFGERGSELSFQWVPSHSGIRGNELADRAAAAGSSRDDRWPRAIVHVHIPPLREEAHSEVKNRVRFRWARDFEEESRGERWLPTGLPVPQNKVLFRGHPLLVASLMSRITWGRRRHLGRLTLCVCGREVSFPHCLFQCPDLAATFAPLHARMEGAGLALGIEALSRAGQGEPELLRLAADLLLGSPIAHLL